MTFDGWDAQYFGDCLTYGQDSLMHYRTKGSKNGVRRFQTESGEWTPLGLKERRIREGFGERRAARKEARAQRKAARAAERSANLERAMKYKAEQKELRRKRNPKNLTDEELQKGIERLKMEQEYRELRKSPLIEVGQKVVQSYFEGRARKAEAEGKRKQQEINYINAVANLRKAEGSKIQAKADRRKATSDILDNLTNGKGKREATSKYWESRNKNTIRGAVIKSVSNMISKEGNNLVKEMPDESVSKRTKTKVSNILRKAKQRRTERMYELSGGTKHLNY